MNSCLLNYRAPKKVYQDLVDNITHHAGMRPIRVIQSDTPNACATEFPMDIFGRGERVIAYNPEFLAQIGNGWAIAAAFAHEVGHHRNLHLHERVDSSQQAHQQELDADLFAGIILRKIGGPLDDILRIFNSIQSPGSYTHPNTYLRRRKMRDGWLLADQKLSPKKYARKVQNPWLQAAKGITLGVAIGGIVAALSKD